MKGSPCLVNFKREDLGEIMFIIDCDMFHKFLRSVHYLHEEKYPFLKFHKNYVYFTDGGIICKNNIIKKYYTEREICIDYFPYEVLCKANFSSSKFIYAHIVIDEGFEYLCLTTNKNEECLFIPLSDKVYPDVEKFFVFDKNMPKQYIMHKNVFKEILSKFSKYYVRFYSENNVLCLRIIMDNNYVYIKPIPDMLFDTSFIFNLYKMKVCIDNCFSDKFMMYHICDNYVLVWHPENDFTAVFSVSTYPKNEE